MMQTCFLALATLVIAASGRLSTHANAGLSLTLDAAAAKNRPVTKVITLLKDMLKQLETESTEDEDVYDKLACWCSTNEKSKTQSISDAETKIADLTTKLEEHSAAMGRLGTEIKGLEGEVGKNQKALDVATALREKQLADFNAEEKDLLQSVSALKAAITVLSKHHSPSLIQMSKSHMGMIASTMKQAMERRGAMLEGVMSPSQRKAALSFIQAGDYFDAAPTFRQSYTPQSGEIFGILRQMLDTFEANLADSQKEEATNQKAFADLKVAKEAEISAGQNQVDAKEQELATTTDKDAQAQVDLDDTKKSLDADESFLSSLKEKCQMTDKEWEERQKTRQLEMQAVSEAIKVLSVDDAHDTFTRTFNPAFMQAESREHSARRERASRLLSAVAQKVRNPRLVALAYRVRLDAFTRVKKAIDDMVAQLLQEKQDEIKHKDFCVDEFNKNKLQTEKTEREKQDLAAKTDDLDMTIKTLTDEIAALKKDVSDMQVQMKVAGEDREKENVDFQTTVADQRETQRLLKAALSVLNDFYGQKQGAALLQEQQPAGPPPPPGFKAYKKNAAAGGVVDLIESIIRDAKSMEAEAIRSEEDAQKAYEDFVKQTNSAVEAKSREIVNKSEEKAKKESDLVDTKKATEAVMTELEQLANSDAQLHQSCDFVLKNFDVRQKARDDEVEALKQAKAILAGANFQAFLQKA